MRKALFIPSILLLLFFVVACKQQPKPEETDPVNLDSTLVSDTKAALPDTTIWGHMGEGTSMNVVEFISNNGDTLYLCKEDLSTGKNAEIMGSLRNETDLLAITIRPTEDTDEAPIITCINTTQMLGVWKNGPNKFALYADGSASNTAETLQNWQVINGKLILSMKLKTEYGTTQRYDTLSIVELTDHELVYANKHGDTFKFTK